MLARPVCVVFCLGMMLFSVADSGEIIFDLSGHSAEIFNGSSTQKIDYSDPVIIFEPSHQLPLQSSSRKRVADVNEQQLAEEKLAEIKQQMHELITEHPDTDAAAAARIFLEDSQQLVSPTGEIPLLSPTLGTRFLKL